MRLELNINGSFFNSLDIDDEEFVADIFRFDYRVKKNEERVEAHVLQIKSIFFRQLCKARSFEIMLVAESKMNYLMED